MISKTKIHNILILITTMTFFLNFHACQLPQEQNLASPVLPPDVMEKLTLLEHLSYEYYTENPDSAEIVLNQTLDFLDSLNIPQEKFYTYMRFTQLYQYRKTDFYKAITTLGKALEIFVKHPGEYNSNPYVYVNIGNVFYHYGFYDHAKDFYRISYRFANQREDDWGKALSLQNIALSFQQLQMYDSAMVYLHKAEKLAKKDDGHILMLAQNHAYAGHLSLIRDDSLQYIDLEYHAKEIIDLYNKRLPQSFHLRENISNVTWKEHLARGHKTLSIYYYYQGKKKRSQHHLDSAMIYANKAQSPYLQATISMLGLIQNENKYSDSKLIIESTRIKHIFEQIPNMYIKKMFADSMLVMFENRSIPSMTALYKETSQQISDSISRQKLSDGFTTNIMLMSRISAEYILQRSQLLGDLKTQTIKKQKWIIVTTISTAFLLVIIFLVFFFQKRKIDVANSAMLGKIKMEIKKESTVNKNDTKKNSLDQIFNDIEKIIGTVVENQKLYLQSDLTLNDLASNLHTNQTYLSSYLNKRQNTNFNDFINQYRVKEACRLILEQENDKYTTKMLGEMSGFNSTSTFYAAFKKFTGMSPSSFKSKR